MDGAIPDGSSRLASVGLVLLILVATGAALPGGPSLSDHEAFVAQCARNMRLSGDWILPEFLGTPYARKPPLPYWLVAASSYLSPCDSRTGLPVTTTSARVPSALAAFGTILLLWRLSSSMFGRRTGRVTAVVSSSSMLFLLYSPNATAEMLLTFCCTWSYVHFWYAATSRRGGRRFVHAMLFYVAMGFGMLAKGPAPIAMVAIPLAMWWWLERPLQLLARWGPGGWKQSLRLLIRQAWPQTVRVFTRLWLVPGVLVFALVFMPWVLAVVARNPGAMDIWNWQYWQRAQGNYEDTRVRGFFYYVPVAVGLVAPWVFMIFEAIAAPWLRRYVRYRRAMFYCGLWALMGVLVMSKMEFKKPYYIAPAVPGLLLLLSVVVDRFYAWVPHSGPAHVRLTLGPWRQSLEIADVRRAARWGLGLLSVLAMAGVMAIGHWLRRDMPNLWIPLTVMAAISLWLFLLACAVHLRGHGHWGMTIVSVTMIGTFQGTWYLCGRTIDQRDDLGKLAALDHALNDMRLPEHAKVLWPVSEPPARLSFYFNRRTDYLIPPEEIVRKVLDRKRDKAKLQRLVEHRVNELIESSEPVYFLLSRKRYELWRSILPRRAHIVATATDSPMESDDDWVIVSNTQRTTLMTGSTDEPESRQDLTRVE